MTISKPIGVLDVDGLPAYMLACLLCNGRCLFPCSVCVDDFFFKWDDCQYCVLPNSGFKRVPLTSINAVYEIRIILTPMH